MENPIASAIEANLHRYLDAFATVHGGRLFNEKSYRATYTGSPLFNRIYVASFPSVDDIPLKKILQPFRDWNAPVTWMTGPSTRPTGLGDWLATKGFKHLSDWTGMALDLSELSATHISSGFSYRTVTNEQELNCMIEIARPAFGLSDRHTIEIRALFSQLLIVPEAPFRGYLAYLNKKPVGTCLVLEQGNVAGVYWVATAPDARRQKVATSLTGSVLGQLPQTSVAVLHATPAGLGVYEKMGFKSHCEFGLYGWDPTSC